MLPSALLPDLSDLRPRFTSVGVLLQEHFAVGGKIAHRPAIIMSQALVLEADLFQYVARGDVGRFDDGHDPRQPQRAETVSHTGRGALARITSSPMGLRETVADLDLRPL